MKQKMKQEIFINFCNTDSMKIYFGLIVDKSVTVWPPDYYYGEYIDGNIIKSPQITKTL